MPGRSSGAWPVLSSRAFVEAFARAAPQPRLSRAGAVRSEQADVHVEIDPFVFHGDSVLIPQKFLSEPDADADAVTAGQFIEAVPCSQHVAGEARRQRVCKGRPRFCIARCDVRFDRVVETFG